MERGPLLRHQIDENGGNAGDLNRRAIVAAGAIMRKTLSDITNTGRLDRVGGEDDKENPKIAPGAGANVELMKENTALMKLLAERNKIVEVSNIELQKLRFALQKSKQQNWQLAQANTQMLMELNLGKDRLKASQHELACTTAVLRLKALELEEKDKANRQLREKVCSEEGQAKDADVAADGSHPDGHMNSNPERNCVVETQSSLPMAITRQEAREEKIDRRKSLRRRPYDLKSESCESVEDSFKMEDAIIPDCAIISEPVNEGRRKSLRSSSKLKCESHESTDDPFKIEENTEVSACSRVTEPLQKDNRTQLNSATPSYSDGTIKQRKSEVPKEANESSKSHNEDIRRSLSGRPLRRVAEKVSSYKEMSLKKKMRRVV